MYDDGIFTFAWGNNPKRSTLKGRRCRVVAWGSLNSCLVKFLDNGQTEIVSKWALRKEKPWKDSLDSETLFENIGSDY